MAAYWEIAAHSAYIFFSEFKYIIVNLVFSHFCFWKGNFFLTVSFSDHCLQVFVPFNVFFISNTIVQIWYEPKNWKYYQRNEKQRCDSKSYEL